MYIGFHDVFCLEKVLPLLDNVLIQHVFYGGHVKINHIVIHVQCILLTLSRFS